MQQLNGHRKGVKFVYTDQGTGWTAACRAELGKADETIRSKVASAFLSGWPLRLACKPLKKGYKSTRTDPDGISDLEICETPISRSSSREYELEPDLQL